MTQTLGTAGYARVVDRFVEATQQVSFQDLHEPFLAFIPAKPARVLDVGAGCGRDAAVLASMGHAVVAVEPLAAFRAAAKDLYSAPNIEWVEDSLPSLAKLRDVPNQFDFVLASAVWHHINDAERHRAMSRISHLLEPGGVFALSLRSGPAGAGTHIFPTDGHATIDMAQSAGFDVLLNIPNQPSLMPGKSDVVWTRLAFRRQ